MRQKRVNTYNRYYTYLRDIILNLKRMPYTRVGVPLCYYNIPIPLSRRKRLT
jgi:hypothetical protein